MIDRERLQRDMLLECRDDYVGLWSILWHLRNDYMVTDPQERRRITQEALGELLEAGLVQAGCPTADGRGFQAWSLPLAQALARIQSEWDALGREPDIGDIVWFTTTKKGDELVDALPLDTR